MYRFPVRLKWILSVVVLLLVMAALIYWERGPGKQGISEAPAAVPAAARPASPPVSPLVQKFRAEPPVERVKAFYQEESKRVGAVDPDPAGTEARLREVAAELNPDEVRWLKNTALDASQPGDGRFFATYLLALGNGTDDRTALKDIAMAPIPKTPRTSAAELERQIRAQAIEGIGHARGEQDAQDDLLDIISTSEDEFLRDRAHRSLYAWQTGHSVEEQDQAALRQVQKKK